MEKPDIAQVMELLETIQQTAMDMGDAGTIERAARMAIVNNCFFLISDTMKAEWEKSNDGA